MRHTTIAAILAGLMLCAGPASAHAFLKTANPAVGSTVQAAPNQVAIEFTEGVEPRFSTIAVQDASGASVAARDVKIQGDHTHHAVALMPLQPGTYKEIWHATAVDTHKTEGNYSFTVKP